MTGGSNSSNQEYEYHDDANIDSDEAPPTEYPDILADESERTFKLLQVTSINGWILLVAAALIAVLVLTEAIRFTVAYFRRRNSRKFIVEDAKRLQGSSSTIEMQDPELVSFNKTVSHTETVHPPRSNFVYSAPTTPSTPSRNSSKIRQRQRPVKNNQTSDSSTETD